MALFSELFTDIPKYNEKRRGTISMVTLRNLQRSRSNPNLLQQLFQQDPVLSATVSQAAGVLYISNGLVPNGVKNSSSIARPVASDLFATGRTTPDVNLVMFSCFISFSALSHFVMFS